MRGYICPKCGKKAGVGHKCMPKRTRGWGHTIIVACLAAVVGVVPTKAQASALTSAADYSAAANTEFRRGTPSLLMVKGQGTNSTYMLEVDQTTGLLPVSGSLSLSNDTNYGTVGANTLRTAAQVGNATGAAAFNAGTTSAQTLRVVLPTDQTAIPVTDNGGSLTVDGTVTANAGSGTFAVSAVALPLPSGASTSANQSTEIASLASIDGKFGSLGQKAMAGSAPVVIASDQNAVPVSGTVTANAGSGTFAVSAAALPLPSGASTSANQTTGNSSLSSIDGKLGSLGQKTMAGSAPVTIASDQSALAVTGTFFQATQPVSGTVTANAGTGTFAVSAAALPLPSGASTSAKQPALGTAGTASADVITVQGITSMTALKVDGSAVTQPVSGTVTANIGTSGSLALDASVIETHGTKAPGTAATKSGLVGGVYNSTPPTLTDGQQAALQLDVNGNAKISGSITASNPSVSATGSAVPAQATMAGGSDGTNLRALKVSSTGVLSVDGSAVTQPVSGTVATSNFPSTADVNTGLAGASTIRVIPAGRASTTTTPLTYDYTGGTVTTAAYTQVVASTTNAINRLYVFDSSGSAIIIATGAAASEVDRIYLPPGGSPSVYEINIPASTRISIKALDTNASAGRLIITGLN